MIYARPAWPEADTLPVPAEPTWAQGLWAQITDFTTAIPTGFWYATAGLVIAAGIASSIRIAIGHRARTARRVKSDKFLTFLAAGVATGVVATGMWKFFGDVLNIDNPFARGALFAFFEIAMLASAFRSRRFRLDRAAKQETDPGHTDRRIDVDGWAVWALALLSGLFAAADEHTLTGKAVRVVAPLLAAWMWERGLAGELMQFTRSGGRLNLRLSTERVLVWLRIAEPVEQRVGDVDRKRRVAQFARTAYRLHLLTERDAKGWRVSWIRWRLRRQTESANEHLKLATDPELLGEVRAQLALLYGAEAGTSRAAVAELNPLTPAPRMAICSAAHVPPADAQGDSQPPRTEEIHGEVRSEGEGSQSGSHPDRAAENRAENAAAISPETRVAKGDAKVPASAVKTAVKASHPLADHPNESVRRLAKAFARKPGGTNAELAKLAKVSPGTANRYMAEVRAAFGTRGESDSGSQELAPPALIGLPIREASQPTQTPVNGSHPHLEESRP